MRRWRQASFSSWRRRSASSLAFRLCLRSRLRLAQWSFPVPLSILFALILLAAWVFVPGSYFQTILKHPVGFGEYLTLSWLAASLATVAGALGASLEDEDTVREAAYGYRQRRRSEANDREDGSDDS